MNNQTWGAILIVFSATSFAAMPLFAQVAYDSGVTPLTLLFLRFAIGGVALHIWMWTKRIPYPSRASCNHLLGIGGIGFVLQSLCFFTAIRFADPALVVVLLYAYPALVTVAESVFLNISLDRRKGVAIMLTAIGAALTTATTLNSQPAGILLALMASFIYATYVLLIGRVMQKEAPLPSCSIIFTAAALVLRADL